MPDNQAFNGENLGLPPGDWMPDPCKSCGCPVYEQKFLLMRQSALSIRGNGQEQVGVHPVMTCTACGWVHGTEVEDKTAPKPEDFTPENVTEFLQKSVEKQALEGRSQDGTPPENV